jgi:hypothetical protein
MAMAWSGVSEGAPAGVLEKRSGVVEGGSTERSEQPPGAAL